MLNDEGWVLLMFLLLFMGVLLSGLRRLRPDCTMADRLTVSEGGFSRNTGVFMSLCGAFCLGVLPGLLYGGGPLQLVGLLSVLLGGAVLLLVLLPKFLHLPGSTPVEALQLSPKLRAVFALFSLLPVFVLTAASLSLTARFVAGVFSLHYLISLVALSGVVLVLCLLQNAAGRAVSDSFAAFLPILALCVLCGYVGCLNQDKISAYVSELLAAFGQEELSPLSLLSSVCMGLGVPGLMLPLLRGTASQSGQKKGGLLAFLLFCLLLLLSGCCGLFGALVDDSLSDTVAAETVLLQLASWSSVPSPVRGVLCAVLILLPLCGTQAGLKGMSSLICWDIVQPNAPLMPEKKLLSAAHTSVPLLLLPLFLAAAPATVPLRSYLTLALLLSAPFGVIFLFAAFSRLRSGKRTVLALSAGEITAIAGVICSCFFPELGFLPVLPTLTVTVLFLLLGGDK